MVTVGSAPDPDAPCPTAPPGPRRTRAPKPARTSAGAGAGPAAPEAHATTGARGEPLPPATTRDLGVIPPDSHRTIELHIRSDNGDGDGNGTNTPPHPATKYAPTYLAGGIPWRCTLSPVEAPWSAPLLPLGTRLAAGAPRTLARTQNTTTGPDFGRIPDSLRDTCPHTPHGCTGMEATLFFPTVLA